MDSRINKRTLSSRKDNRPGIKNLTTHPSARTIQGARSIHLKHDMVLNKARAKPSLVPSYGADRKSNVQLRKAVSGYKLPGEYERKLKMSWKYISYSFNLYLESF